MTRRPGHEGCRSRCDTCGLTWCPDCDTDGDCRCFMDATDAIQMTAAEARDPLRSPQFRAWLAGARERATAPVSADTRGQIAARLQPNHRPDGAR